MYKRQALYAGKGKVAEVAEAIRDAQADIAIFNHELSAALSLIHI